MLKRNAIKAVLPSHAWLDFETDFEQYTHLPLSSKQQSLMVQIDVTENEALRARFFVTAFPLIVHLHEDKTRHFSGIRERSQVEDLPNLYGKRFDL